MARNNAGTFSQVVFGGNGRVGVWDHYLGMETTATSRQIYFNGLGSPVDPNPIPAPMSLGRDSSSHRRHPRPAPRVEHHRPADGDGAGVRADPRQLDPARGLAVRARGLAEVGHRHARPHRRVVRLPLRGAGEPVCGQRHRHLRRDRHGGRGRTRCDRHGRRRVPGLNVAAGGGNFLLVFNGTNDEQQYDGTVWAPWTATGTPTPSITWACQFKIHAVLRAARRSVVLVWAARQHRRRVRGVPAAGRVRPGRRRRGRD
jgi:hypothetical protein